MMAQKRRAYDQGNVDLQKEKKKFLNKYSHTVHTCYGGQKSSEETIKRAKKHPDWYTAEM